MLVEDLMGQGMSGPQSVGLGNSIQSVTGAGTTQTAGTTITRGRNVVLVTSATTTAEAVTLASDISVGTPIYVITSVAATLTSAMVFCPVSGSMNGTSNGNAVLTTGVNAVFIQTSPKVWISIPSL